MTEVPGNLVASEAVDMVRTRYAFAAEYCAGKAVLELACGPGSGLGRLAQTARRVVGGDFTPGLLVRARSRYGPRIPLVRLDAHDPPFRAGSFDVVVLFEAIYFLADFEKVLARCREVLAAKGVLLLATANPQVPGFNPSPHSTRYYSAAELELALRARGFSVELFAGFPLSDLGPRDRLLRLAKTLAVRLNLIPRTMTGKELLKRLVFGKLKPFPGEVTNETGERRELVRLGAAHQAAHFKVIYAVARKQG